MGQKVNPHGARVGVIFGWSTRWYADKKDKLDLGDLRYSVGFGLAWISPMGPLKLSFAFPLNKKDSDELQRFQFQIGTGF